MPAACQLCVRPSATKSLFGATECQRSAKLYTNAGLSAMEGNEGKDLQHSPTTLRGQSKEQLHAYAQGLQLFIGRPHEVC